jgi:hypothetical protein
MIGGTAASTPASPVSATATGGLSAAEPDDHEPRQGDDGQDHAGPDPQHQPVTTLVLHELAFPFGNGSSVDPG